MNRPHIRRIRRAPTGHRVSESHHRTRQDISSHDIRLMQAVYDPDNGIGYGTIADKWEIPRSTVRNYITGRCRVYD